MATVAKRISRHNDYLLTENFIIYKNINTLNIQVIGQGLADPSLLLPSLWRKSEVQLQQSRSPQHPNQTTTQRVDPNSDQQQLVRRPFLTANSCRKNQKIRCMVHYCKNRWQRKNSCWFLRTTRIVWANLLRKVRGENTKQQKRRCHRSTHTNPADKNRSKNVGLGGFANNKHFSRRIVQKHDDQNQRDEFNPHCCKQQVARVQKEIGDSPQLCILVRRHSPWNYWRSNSSGIVREERLLVLVQIIRVWFFVCQKCHKLEIGICSKTVSAKCRLDKRTPPTSWAQQILIVKTWMRKIEGVLCTLQSIVFVEPIPGLQQRNNGEDQRNAEEENWSNCSPSKFLDIHCWSSFESFCHRVASVLSTFEKLNFVDKERLGRHARLFWARSGWKRNDVIITSPLPIILNCNDRNCSKSEKGSFAAGRFRTLFSQISHFFSQDWRCCGTVERVIDEKPWKATTWHQTWYWQQIFVVFAFLCDASSMLKCTLEFDNIFRK